MARKLDNQSKDILSYRPNIGYIEPDQIEGDIEGEEIPVQVEEVKETRDEVRRLAKAVNSLAVALQAKADIRAKNMTVKLDQQADAAVIDSMKRFFGHENINAKEITYEQYRICKDRIKEKGMELGERMIISNEDLQKAVDLTQKPSQQSGKSGLPFTQLGGFDTDAARTGGLRPELNKAASIVDPLDMEELQAYLVGIFVNAIWQKFFLPILGELPVYLPETLADIPSDGLTAEDLVSLGVPVFGYDKPEQPTSEGEDDDV